MFDKYIKYKSKYLKLKSQLGGSAITLPAVVEQTYNTDFEIRTSYHTFGNKTKEKFGIDLLVVETNPMPINWKNSHHDPLHNYMALVTFTSHKFPNSDISVDWNIEPNFNIMEEEEQYIIELRKIIAFQKSHSLKILHFVKNQFAQIYPDFVLS